jgi:hypothetical protein
MNKLALAALAFATLTTGCAAMGTKRQTGGAQIQKTASDDSARDLTANDAPRADLGER